MADISSRTPALLDRQAIQHAARTTLAAVTSLLAASLLGLPEAYWAAVTTMIVMQSTVGAALTVSIQRLAGTALGALMGAFLAERFGSSVLAFAAGIFLLGLICTILGRAHPLLRGAFDNSAYRFAGVTLAIVMLVVRSQSPWMAAFHRFAEISAGITVGLILTVLWPEPERPVRPAAAPAK
jgi:uncharacterized membrane protein YccC